MVDRKQSGESLAASQLVQKKVAAVQTGITLGLQVWLRRGRVKDEGGAAIEITLFLKRNSCGKSLDIARMACHLVNLEVVNTYEVTHDIQAVILAL